VAAQKGDDGERAGVQRCDFCGEPSSTVRRVALDRDYDRLLKPHREQYACPSCSEAKERERRGLGRR
jgi:ribosomal protein L37AE/L43A